MVWPGESGGVARRSEGGPTFDGAEHVSVLVWEAADASRLELEAGLASLLDVAHVPQVPDEDAPSCRPHHQLVPAQRHRVHLERDSERDAASHTRRVFTATIRQQQLTADIYFLDPRVGKIMIFSNFLFNNKSIFVHG